MRVAGTMKSCRAGAASALVLTSIVLSVLPAEAQNPAAFTSEDALNVLNAGVQDITSDGRFIAATLWTHRDRLNVDHMRFGDPTYISPSLAELVVIDAEDGGRRSLFDEPVQVRSPSWSPDGRTLAFFLLSGESYELRLYDRIEDETRSVPLQGGRSIASSSPLLWRPDGSGIFVTLREEGWAERSRRAFEEITEAAVIVQDSREPFLSWESVRNLNDLVVATIVDPSSGAVRELLPESRVGSFQQSTDGSFLTFVETTTLRTSYSRTGGAEFELRLLDLDSGETHSLTEPQEERRNRRWNGRGDTFAYAEEGDVFVRSVFDDEARRLTDVDPDADPDPATESDADTTRVRYSIMEWGPDDATLLVESRKGYHLLDASSGSIELVYEKPDEDADDATRLSLVNWSPDGHHLYFTHAAPNRWERGLVRFDLRSRTFTELVRDASVYSGWRFSRDGTRVIYSSSDGDLPNELFAADADLSRPTRLTDLNPWLRERTLTRSELVEYLDVDGNTLYGILYYPVDYREGERYPLVAEIYESFFDNGFNVNMNLIANAGFFGFRPSARLETGYPGEGWMKGVTAGINKLIDRGLVDGERLGVHGTSYGGYATNLLITQTDRFAAAINISGKVNIISFLGDSPKITTRNYRAAEDGQDRIGATLWEQPHKYIQHSAVMFADRIETPLLMLTGEGDWNVPATNQREMYYALRRLEKEVVWVHYMNAGHGAGRSGTVADFHDHWSRIIAWYTEHFDLPDERRADR